MRKTVVINVVGLSGSLIGENTPFLARWSAGSRLATIKPAMPAVTCSAQATYLTGKWPEEHGIVGNGWYFKDECEIKFWRQSNKLIQSPKIWEVAKAMDPTFTVANMCWWYNMYSSADYTLHRARNTWLMAENYPIAIHSQLSYGMNHRPDWVLSRCSTTGDR